MQKLNFQFYMIYKLPHYVFVDVNQNDACFLKEKMILAFLIINLDIFCNIFWLAASGRVPIFPRSQGAEFHFSENLDQHKKQINTHKGHHMASLTF